MKQPGKQLPEGPIMILALVQAASTFLRNSLAATFDLPVARRVSGGIWNRYEVLSPVALDQMRVEMGVAYSHAHPDVLNRQLMEAALDRVILNVRDPRQVTVSLVHFIDNHVASNRVYYRAHGLPSGYLARSFEWKLSFHIEQTYPMLVDWVSGWTEIADSEAVATRFLVLNHSELKADRDDFFRRIYRFYQVQSPESVPVPPEHDGRNHNFFRAGRNDEWRGVLSDLQIRQVNDGLPESLANRFDWFW